MFFSKLKSTREVEGYMSQSSELSPFDLLNNFLHSSSRLNPCGLIYQNLKSILLKLIFSSVLILSLSLLANAATLTCPGTTTLEELIACIEMQMPRKGSEGFIIPKSSQIRDWRSVVSQILGGNCKKIRLPGGLRNIYSVGTFHDADKSKDYCVLMEIFDGDGDSIVDKGWGTFIINLSSGRELSIQIPHPIADVGTTDEGIGVFKETDSRSFVMAGSHPDANSEISTCQSSFPTSDVAHNVANFFQSTQQELLRYYNSVGLDFVAIQLHGMGSSSCEGVDVYLTHGLSLSPVLGDKILELQSNLLFYNPGWVVTVPGDSPSCNLSASTNVQGRLLNGVASGAVCYTTASKYSGKFIHIEQKADFRISADWVDAAMDTWP